MKKEEILIKCINHEIDCIKVLKRSYEMELSCDTENVKKKISFCDGEINGLKQVLFYVQHPETATEIVKLIDQVEKDLFNN